MKLSTIEVASSALAALSLPLFTIGILRLRRGGLNRRSGQHLLGLGVLCWIGVFILNPPHSGSRPFQQAGACKKNLKNLASALERYAQAHKGGYPKQLAELTPTYLATLPCCPSIEADTYSPGYQIIPAHGQRPAIYRLTCSGHHHQAAHLGPDLPAYDSQQGLIEE